LLRQLTDIARVRGITHFEADVLAGNAAMLQVFRRSGLRAREQLEGGSVHVTLLLGASACEASALTQ
jgi:hypothetical protein